MEVAAGAMTPLLRKLGELLWDEYKLEKRVRKRVESLITELEIMHAVLRKVGEKPPDQLDEQVRIWAGKVRELSYNMEDAVDAFLVRVLDGHDRGPNNVKNKVKKFVKKTTKLFSNGKALHQISDAMEEAQGLAKELGELRQRYMLEAHASSTGDTIDPRLKAVYKDVTELVGIEDTRDELIKKLSDGGEGSKQQLKTISIVGFGGLGKTTLAKAVYDKIKVEFDCGAFVSVSQNPNTTKIFKKMLYELDANKFGNINEAVRDVEQLINELRMFLQNKRYLIVIDDIWDEEAWEIIKCAFSESSLGSRVMTTTRIESVSKACSSYGDHIIYKMKPLAVDDSKKLFYKRIFPQGIECPHELEQVSRDILKKCGGVPLAIITIASLLASNGQQIKPKYEWDNLVNSIGRGLSEGSTMRDMQRILSFSYYNLPSHLKTCLLYLSIFPEDYVINKTRLIWRWIAEGFVQCGRQVTTSLFEVGESYLNDLINRSMIQPAKISPDGRAHACRVHDMVLDLICSISVEENFVTILDGTQAGTSNSWSKVRRLSFQNSMSELTTPKMDTTSMSQVRSATLFKANVGLIQSLSCFQVLRVLDLEGCDLRTSSHKSNLWCVEKLLHLRYLGLRRTLIFELPMGIGKLRVLQILDLRGTGFLVLPPSIVRLGHLICLYIDYSSRMPVGMGNLVSLQELSTLHVADAIEKQLGQLIELRVLELRWEKNDESLCNALVVSLRNLQKLQILLIEHDGTRHDVGIRHDVDTRHDVIWDSWVPPPHLHTLTFHGCTSTLPRWINSSSLPLLSTLCIQVNEVRGEDIQILGTLPALCSLDVKTTKPQYTYFQRFNIDAGAFPCLRDCSFLHFTTVPSMFPQGAMPMLESFHFSAPAWEIVSGELDVGMGHLPFLHSVTVFLWMEEEKASKFLEENAAVRFAVGVQPNRPNRPSLRGETPLFIWPGEEKSSKFQEAYAALRLAVGAHPNRPTLGIASYVGFLKTLE